MCAFTASRSEKMESLSTGGPGWQVLRVPAGRQAGGGVSPPLAGQNMDEWGWACAKQCKNWMCQRHYAFMVCHARGIWNPFSLIGFARQCGCADL